MEVASNEHDRSRSRNVLESIDRHARGLRAQAPFGDRPRADLPQRWIHVHLPGRRKTLGRVVYYPPGAPKVLRLVIASRELCKITELSGGC